jgi:hypothetical protein
MLASSDLRRKQNKHCVAAEVIGSKKKTILIAGFIYVHQILPFLSKSAADDF